MIEPVNDKGWSVSRSVYKLLFLGVIFLGSGTRFFDLQLSLQRNDAYLEVPQAMQGVETYSSVIETLEGFAAQDPVRAAWAKARLAAVNGLPAERYFEVIFQDPEYLHYARAAYREDVTLATLATQIHPEEWRAVGWAADVLLETNPEEAIFYYQKATELNPMDDLNWRHLAELAEWSDPEIAIEAAHTACRLNPVADGSCFREAVIAYRLGDWERCIGAYEFLIERDSDLYPESWAQYILVLEYLGRSEEAEQWFAEALKVAPADYGPLFDKLAISNSNN